ncbi:hypothetical protein N658DRAFT_518847 [Parathielavia hyrcaniae]|uniref:HIG1 domain-containing protein n=1 Tax=Parathielavia hyrcaniae TaxID=113614 RepID=A0AAN6SY51_9PEZI|nr:hypothetical protein N658DRAFT_518847 [Parathielavia hyrcaniae]
MTDRPLSSRPLPSSFDSNDDFYNESGFRKVLRRLKEEPLIPVGCALTVAAFVNAYRAMRRGDHLKVQRMFRARVAAQAFTVVAMVAGGMYYAEDRNKQKELWKLKEQQDAEERRQKWIRELEARDEEDKAVMEMMNKRRKKVAERSSSSSSSSAGTVTAETKAALKEAKAAGVSGEAAAGGNAAAEFAGQAAGSEARSSSGVLGSLGGLFSSSSNAAADSANGLKGEKPNSGDPQK